MPIVAGTRLHIRSPIYLPGFFVSTFRSMRQAQSALGYLGGRLNREGRAFWTVSVWEDEDAMRAYRQSGAHKDAMRRVNDWCDELATAHWVQETVEMPGWEDIARRVAEGRFLKLQHASPRHLAREVLPPKSRGSMDFAPKRRAGSE